MLAHLKWTYPQAGQWFAAASHLQACQMAWWGCGHSRAVCDAIHRRGGCWPIRGNSRGPYRTVAIGGGLRPCWPSDNRAWSNTADGSGCARRDRTVGGSSGTYVVDNEWACMADRNAARLIRAPPGPPKLKKQQRRRQSEEAPRGKDRSGEKKTFE